MHKTGERHKTLVTVASSSGALWVPMCVVRKARTGQGRSIWKIFHKDFHTFFLYTLILSHVNNLGFKNIKC